MSKIQNLRNNYRLVYRPTSPLLKAVVTATIALCTLTMGALLMTHQAQQRELALLQSQRASLQEHNEDLRQRIQALGTVESYRRIAGEELGLVDPETIIFETE